jgi:hypothetical protein
MDLGGVCWQNECNIAFFYELIVNWYFVSWKDVNRVTNLQYMMQVSEES